MPKPVFFRGAGNERGNEIVYSPSGPGHQQLREVLRVNKIEDRVSIHHDSFNRISHVVANRRDIVLVDVNELEDLVAFTARENRRSVRAWSDHNTNQAI